jgi:hypothetical protein
MYEYLNKMIKSDEAINVLYIPFFLLCLLWFKKIRT